MAELSPDDFGAYFEAVHGYAPFPWQSRLLVDVAREGRWPGSLDLPTGTGKTAALDVALFHLALDAAHPAGDRRAPRRIVMVVDRRTVVDQAFERAKQIATALREAKGGILRKVAERLASLTRGAAPVALAQLRGGMPRDDAWARRPDQPLIAVSTVDQVGSRLLFRGYGVSEGMSPIHAGLVGNDTLLLLDEVHLSEPFRQTLESLARYRAWAGRRLPDRWQFVVMSATPGNPGEFTLDDHDRQSPELAKRLAARKPVGLLPEVKTSGAEPARRATFAAACAEAALPFASPGRAVGVIVNRVATARLVFDSIRLRLGAAATVFLVTGRMRPLDRDDLDAQLGRLVRSGRKRDPSAKAVVVVATQCIEAGADFDFDAVVTECASLDALRQRFGRLNRVGAIADAGGAVLVRLDALGEDADPIYGSALAATWRWLNEAPRDFGIDAIAPALAKNEELEKLICAKTDAPVMLPAHLDAWVQTKPLPEVDPDVSLWLHGIGQNQAPEVQIVWRADLTEDQLADARGKAQTSPSVQAVVARVEACPPVGLEALSVPIYAARAWLESRDDDPPELADVEGGSLAGDDEPRRGREPRTGRPALLWRGDNSDVVGPDEIRPGCTLVVPSAYGGIADRNWDPSSLTDVADLGDRARWQQTRRPTLRLHPAVVAGTMSAGPTPSDPEDGDANDRELVDEWLRTVTGTDPIRIAMVEALRRKGKRRPTIVRMKAFAQSEERGENTLPNGYYVLVGRSRVPDPRLDAASRGDLSTEDDGASLTGVEVTLDEHLRGVASWAGEFAEGCGLPPSLAGDLVLAGRWHDAGKVDRRFQRMLHGGSEARAISAREPLAKSALVAADRAARIRAAERSGYPRGARHELASVALLEAGSWLLREAADRDLVLHLVASHHGWCRPLAPVVPDAEPVELELSTKDGMIRVQSDHCLARLDSGIADRFWRLVERYGWFGLAWLEAILRLADHRRSEEEQSLGSKDET